MHNILFCYGTLQSEEVISSLIGRKPPVSSSAVLENYGAYYVEGTDYPGIREDSGNKVQGMLYYDLDKKVMNILDRFEGDLYERVIVSVVDENDKTVDAFVYKTKKEKLYMLNEKPWDLEVFMERELDHFIRGYVRER